MLAGDITRHAIYDTIDHAFITTHIGNGPTQLLILGRDYTERVLEITAVDVHGQLLVVASARAGRLGLVGCVAAGNVNRTFR